MSARTVLLTVPNTVISRSIFIVILWLDGEFISSFDVHNLIMCMLHVLHRVCSFGCPWSFGPYEGNTSIPRLRSEFGSLRCPLGKQLRDVAAVVVVYLCCCRLVNPLHELLIEQDVLTRRLIRSRSHSLWIGSLTSLVA